MFALPGHGSLWGFSTLVEEQAAEVGISALRQKGPLSSQSTRSASRTYLGSWGRHVARYLQQESYSGELQHEKFSGFDTWLRVPHSAGGRSGSTRRRI